MSDKNENDKESSKNHETSQDVAYSNNQRYDAAAAAAGVWLVLKQVFI